jgi:hypothetical protein
MGNGFASVIITRLDNLCSNILYHNLLPEGVDTDLLK